MKIYFTCSTAEFAKHKYLYLRMRQFLIDQGHILTRDWLPETQARIDSGDVELLDIKKIYQGCIKAIQEADLVIVEDTVSNFSTGHQITIALQRQKPILVLWQGKKHHHFNRMFIHGIESEYLEVAQYSGNVFGSTISSFIHKYENAHLKNRFHLVLDNVERKYLDWAQYNKGESRTRLIRSAVRNAIEQDPDYQAYLSKETSE